MVISWHGDHSVPVNSTPAALIHGVASDGRGSVAGPVQHIPSPVVCQALHWANIWEWIKDMKEGERKTEMNREKMSKEKEERGFKQHRGAWKEVRQS